MIRIRAPRNERWKNTDTTNDYATQAHLAPATARVQNPQKRLVRSKQTFQARKIAKCH